MRGTKAKLLRKIVQGRTVGFQNKLYHMPTRRTTGFLTVALTSNCTRYWYKVLKRSYKKHHGAQQVTFWNARPVHNPN